MKKHMDYKHYRLLLGMIVLHFLAMYAFMYAMVDVFSNVHHNWNQFYMAGLMTASMILIELPLMGRMYSNKKWNTGILVAGIICLTGFFFLIRQQTGISDKQFLKSMIPHHAAAILMCERAPIQDSEIKALCEAIISGQQSEIDFMQAKLRKLGN